MSKDLRNTLIAVAVFLVLSVGAGWIVNDTNDQLKEMREKNDQLKQGIDALKKKIAEGPELKRQLDELNQNFRDYVKILPSAEVATQEKLYRIVQSYCESSQITLQGIIVDKTRLNTSQNKGGEFEEVGVNFRVSCGFEPFIKFLNSLERHEPFLKVNSFSLTPAGAVKVVDGKEVIDLGATIEVTTYKYVPKK